MIINRLMQVNFLLERMLLTPKVIVAFLGPGPQSIRSFWRTVPAMSAHVREAFFLSCSACEQEFSPFGIQPPDFKAAPTSTRPRAPSAIAMPIMHNFIEDLASLVFVHKLNY